MKNFKEYVDSRQENEQILPTQFIIFPNFQGCEPAKNVAGQKTTLNTKDILGNEPNKDYRYFTTEKKSYVEKMIKDAQGDRWKTFEPISVIVHPILQNKYLAIDGNHRLGAFKIGGVPQINALIIRYEDILLATPDTVWSAGVIPKTIPLLSAMNNKSIDLKKYFTIRDLKIPQQQVSQQQQISSKIYNQPVLKEWLVLSGLNEQNMSIEDIVRQYLDSDIGKKYENYDCKTVTRAFIRWADGNGIHAEVLHLAPPSAEFVKMNPQFKGKSGKGDSHMMPVVNGYAIDFTVRQFGINRPYKNPLITPLNGVKSVYGKFGYYTDSPDWFNGGKSFYLGPWYSIPTVKKGFQDEIM